MNYSSLDERTQRLRAVFRLARGEPVPCVDEIALTAYYRYLAANLEFPFEAIYRPESGFLRLGAYRLTVVALGEPDDEPWIDEDRGVLCTAKQKSSTVHVPLVDLDLPDPGRNRQLAFDYQHWFWNGR